MEDDQTPPARATAAEKETTSGRVFPPDHGEVEGRRRIIYERERERKQRFGSFVLWEVSFMSLFRDSRMILILTSKRNYEFSPDEFNSDLTFES